ncbi:hypothetical protein BOS5A_210088 [Bosea sp. EC-HK365B]|nr:hypothetical protein BOSE7B_140087 [Bosea sp. 7B]CAD5272124.1 hypothetical protein BOSE21B_20086 [Bosea sp. 21B]VVT59297.1 hypothetical protein BOS5A_210088 [Bosea sp. EC-HK365B]VXC26417.1 hypothetical protein BOSE127_170640 [Bosea sp. 127]
MGLPPQSACRPGQAAKRRRSGIHSGAFPIEVPEWVPGLHTVARDDPRTLNHSPYCTVSLG